MAIAAAAAPPRPPPPAPAAGCWHEGRVVPPPRHRSHAQGCTCDAPEQWRRLSRVPSSVTAVDCGCRHGRSPRPPAASRCRGRILVAARHHSQGSGGGVQGWSRAKEDGWGRRQRPPRPLRPNAGIRPCSCTRVEAAVGGLCASAADRSACFLLLVSLPRFPCACSRSSPPPRLLASTPLHLRRRAHPSAPTATCGGNGACCRPRPLQKARRDGDRAAGRKEEDAPPVRPTPRLRIRPWAPPPPPARSPARATELLVSVPPLALECR